MLENKLSKNRPLINYQTHMAAKGWQLWRSENRLGGLLDQQLGIEAVKIKFEEPFHDIYYSVYFNEKEGWSQEVSNGQQAGTTGKKKPIMGIKIRLDEAGASEFDILYRLHKFDGDWTKWAQNGEELLSGGVKLNAIQIKLENKSVQ